MQYSVGSLSLLHSLLRQLRQVHLPSEDKACNLPLSPAILGGQGRVGFKKKI